MVSIAIEQIKNSAAASQARPSEATERGANLFSDKSNGIHDAFAAIAEIFVEGGPADMRTRFPTAARRAQRGPAFDPKTGSWSDCEGERS
jgi:hypothetical protein